MEKKEEVSLVPDPLKEIAKIDKEMEEAKIEAIEERNEDLDEPFKKIKEIVEKETGVNIDVIEALVPEIVEEVKKGSGDIFVAAKVARMIETPIEKTTIVIDEAIKDTKERLEDPKVPELKELTKEVLLLADLKELREAMKDYSIGQTQREIDYLIKKYKEQ